MSECSGAIRELWNLLAEAGFLPESALADPLALAYGENVLPTLEQSWVRHSANRRVHQNSAILNWISNARSCGAQLTIGIPQLTPQVAASWIGSVFAWWPSGIPAGRWVGIVSSRWGRDLATTAARFHLLKCHCEEAKTLGDGLLYAAGTTVAMYIEHVMSRQGQTALRIDTPKDDRGSVTKWLQQLRRQKIPREEELSKRVSLSPAIKSPAKETLDVVPLRDRVVFALSDRLFAAHVRTGGHVDKLCRARLADPVWQSNSLTIYQGNAFVEPEVAAQYLRLGARIHSIPYEPGAGVGLRAQGTVPRSTVFPRQARLTSLPPTEGWAYLSHCTRKPLGSWPDEDHGEFLDQLLVGVNREPRTTLSALCRMLSTSRIIASHATVRGRFDVVSFTAVPVQELANLRVFRAHRGRWDFEPYGICIRRDWLVERGARPVIYGDNDDWEELREMDRPFFQLHQSRSRRSKQIIDWTVEREWRHLGDLMLAQVPSDAAFVIVPTEADAQTIAALSRWPIAIP